MTTYVLIINGDLNTLLHKIYTLVEETTILPYVLQSVNRLSLTNAYKCVGVNNLGQSLIGEDPGPGIYHCSYLVFKEVQTVNDVAFR